MDQLKTIPFTKEQIIYIKNAFPAACVYEKKYAIKYEYTDYKKIEELVEIASKQLVIDKDIYTPFNQKTPYFSKNLPIADLLNLPTLVGSNAYFFFDKLTDSNIYESTEHLQLYSFGNIWYGLKARYYKIGGLALVNLKSRTILLFATADYYDDYEFPY